MRVAKAPTEMATAPQFDTIILNDDLATALQDAENLVNDFLNK
jgi:guanylate kinase